MAYFLPYRYFRVGDERLLSLLAKDALGSGRAGPMLCGLLRSSPRADSLGAPRVPGFDHAISEQRRQEQRV